MSPEKQVKWGCVADDFTGAADIASFLSDEGIRTVLVCRMPQAGETLPSDAQAVVVALKTRSIPPEKAKKQCMEAFQWLTEQGCSKLYYKYCSTFDSSDKGNIGPVIDMVLEHWNLPFTILCPALLVNGRTVKDGVLYVNGTPLSQTHMRNHPITPMHSSRLKELMAVQGKYPCINLSWRVLESGDQAVREMIDHCKAKYPYFYLAVDCFKEEHSKILARIFSGEFFLTGSSGLASELGKCYWKEVRKKRDLGQEKDSMPRLLLSGSCSEMAGRQIGRYQSQGGCAIRINVERVMNGDLTEQAIWETVKEKGRQDVLIYSWSPAEEIHRIQNQFGAKEVSHALEQIMGSLACRAVQEGYRRIIVAGGETSGAVIGALDISSLRVVESIDPGVPLLIPRDKGREYLRLVLKSGNFGAEDFFIKTLSEEG